MQILPQRVAWYESVTQYYPNSIPKTLEITGKLATGKSPSPVRASPSCLSFGEGGLLHPFPPHGPGNLVWLRSYIWRSRNKSGFAPLRTKTRTCWEGRKRPPRTVSGSCCLVSPTTERASAHGRFGGGEGAPPAPDCASLHVPSVGRAEGSCPEVLAKGTLAVIVAALAFLGFFSTSVLLVVAVCILRMVDKQR